MADDYVLMAYVDNASEKANSIISSGGEAGKQAIMIDKFMQACPSVRKVMTLIGLKNIVEGFSKNDKED